MLVTISIACSLLNNWMFNQFSVRIFTNQGLLDISFPWAPICKFSNFSRFILEKISFSWLINQMLLTNIQNYFLTIEIKYGKVTSVAVKKSKVYFQFGSKFYFILIQLDKWIKQQYGSISQYGPYCMVISSVQLQKIKNLILGCNNWFILFLTWYKEEKF